MLSTNTLRWYIHHNVFMINWVVDTFHNLLCYSHMKVQYANYRSWLDDAMSSNQAFSNFSCKWYTTKQQAIAIPTRLWLVNFFASTNCTKYIERTYIPDVYNQFMHARVTYKGLINESIIKLAWMNLLSLLNLRNLHSIQNYSCCIPHSRIIVTFV